MNRGMGIQSNHKKLKLLQFIAPMAMSLSLMACGGSKSTGSSSAGTNSVSDGVVSIDSTNTPPAPNTNSAATREAFPFGITAYGPADGYQSQRIRFFMGYSNGNAASSLGIDHKLQVRMHLNPSPGRGNGYGGNTPYNTLAATFTLYVENTPVATARSQATLSSPDGNIIDFSGVIYGILHGRSQPVRLYLEVSNIQSDNRTLSGGCLRQYNACMSQVNGYITPQYCSSIYATCSANNTPLSSAAANDGWSMNLKVATDITTTL